MLRGVRRIRRSALVSIHLRTSPPRHNISLNSERQNKAVLEFQESYSFSKTVMPAEEKCHSIHSNKMSDNSEGKRRKRK